MRQPEDQFARDRKGDRTVASMFTLAERIAGPLLILGFDRLGIERNERRGECSLAQQFAEEIGNGKRDDERLRDDVAPK